jgi:hypothetical protein
MPSLQVWFYIVAAGFFIIQALSPASIQVKWWALGVAALCLAQIGGK